MFPDCSQNMPERVLMSNYFQAAKNASSEGIVPAVALSAGLNVFGIQTSGNIKKIKVCLYLDYYSTSNLLSWRKDVEKIMRQPFQRVLEKTE